MIRATTPTLTFQLPFDVLEFCDKILITLAQDNENIFDKTENDVEINGKEIKLSLTQEETLKFNPNGMVSVQVRVLSKGGEALASNIMYLRVCDVLNEEVLK
jgi:hypothetical protein